MIKRILTHNGFWKGVFLMSLFALIVFNVLLWGISGFEGAYWNLTPRKIVGMLVAAFLYSFIVTYGKFWTRFAKEEYRKK